jgi:hypothetical protein
MVWYVAIVAVLNIGLGYALAVYLRPASSHRWATDFDAESTYGDRELYGSGAHAYERDLESSLTS